MIRVNLGRSWEVQVIKNNGFEWVSAWKVDQIWEHKKREKIGIEIDPGASQERRKQCTFEVQFVLFPSVFVVLSMLLLVEQNAC